METLDSLVLIGLTFLLAGFVKGVIGMGLPTVSLAILTTGFGLIPAMSLMIVPSFITNVWQAGQGGAFRELVRRFWVMIVAVVAGVWFGGKVLVTGDTTTLTGLLGMLLCVYAVTGLSRFRIPPPGRAEPWLSPVMGGISGILTGLTGTFVVPGVLYLQSMGLNRNSLIQAMGMLFTVSTVALAVVLGHHKLMSVELGVYSLGGVVPALVGMVVGQRVRNRLSEAVFAKIFFASLLVLGAYIAARAFS
jgi:uncharacterized protein